MHSLPSLVINGLGRTGRLLSPLSYGLSLLIFEHAQPIAAKVYDDLCASQGVTFGKGEPIGTLIIAWVLIVAPLVLARSKILVLGNLVASLLTLLGACSLLFTAGNEPYECFTQAGTYEDNTSGLEGFSFWFAFVLLFSYALLLVDLTIWAVKGAMKQWSARSSR
jgi:hypothetical protein